MFTICRYYAIESEPESLEYFAKIHIFEMYLSLFVPLLVIIIIVTKVMSGVNYNFNNSKTSFDAVILKMKTSCCLPLITSDTLAD